MSLVGMEESADWLLVADVDDTLVGDDDALAEFVAVWRASSRLRLALNSSRPLPSVRATLEGLSLAPDGLICAMGTEVEVDGAPLAGWRQRFEGWDRGPVDAAMAELGFEPHADEFQTPLKASFAVPKDQWGTATRAVKRAGAAARFVTSGESDFDVVPEGAGKGTSTLVLADHFGVAHAHLVVAGDSANDEALFQVSRKGIVVGNARGELRSALEGSADVYFAKATHARGVLEGLEHFGVPLGG